MRLLLMPTWTTPGPRDDTWTSRWYSASTATCWYFRSIMVLSSHCLVGLALITLVVRAAFHGGADHLVSFCSSGGLLPGFRARMSSDSRV